MVSVYICVQVYCDICMCGSCIGVMCVWSMYVYVCVWVYVKYVCVMCRVCVF